MPTTPLDPSAGTRELSPTATDLEDLRTATDANRATLYDLGTDLHLLSDEFRQFRSGVPTYPGPTGLGWRPPLPTYPKCGTPTLPYHPKIPNPGPKLTELTERRSQPL